MAHLWLPRVADPTDASAAPSATGSLMPSLKADFYEGIGATRYEMEVRRKVGGLLRLLSDLVLIQEETVKGVLAGFEPLYLQAGLVLFSGLDSRSGHPSPFVGMTFTAN